MPIPPFALLALGGLAIAYFLRRRREDGASLPARSLPARLPSPKEKPGAVGGYNAAIAVELAPQLAADIIERTRQHDKELTRAFQASAGVTVDGQYGPNTRNALVFWLQQAGSSVSAPSPLVSPSSKGIAYVPPGPVPSNPNQSTPLSIAEGLLREYGSSERSPAVASALAPAVAQIVSAYRRGYYNNSVFVDLVKLFQFSAGLTVDGQYGPASRGALVYFLNIAGMPGDDAPAAVFGRGTKTYTP